MGHLARKKLSKLFIPLFNYTRQTLQGNPLILFLSTKLEFKHRSDETEPLNRTMSKSGKLILRFRVP